MADLSEQKQPENTFLISYYFQRKDNTWNFGDATIGLPDGHPFTPEVLEKFRENIRNHSNFLTVIILNIVNLQDLNNNMASRNPAFSMLPR